VSQSAAASSLELRGPAFFDDPYPAYAALRACGEPVFNRTMQSWIVTRYADVEALLRDPRISKKIGRATPTPFESSVLFLDPPDHGRIRGRLNQAFASLPENLEDRVRRIADGLIDRMFEKRSVDFLQEFALPLPVAVIAEVLGVPDADTAQLHAWSSEFILDDDVGPADKERRQYAAICGMERYFRELIASGAAEGIIASLSGADAAGFRLSAEELIGNCILLMVAGHETTVNLLGNGLYLLLVEPDRLARVRGDAKLLDSAIEEMLRFESPVQLGTFRVAAEEVVIAGCTIAPGQMITAVIGAANRDPGQFANPDVFDLARSPNRHLGFGFGPHRCIGAQLARAEARIGFERLLERLPHLALAVPPQGWLGAALGRLGLGPQGKPTRPMWRQTAIARGLRELRISF
jgi:cytochrome P450